MFLKPGHPLLAGLRFFARLDNPANVRVAEPRPGPPGVVTLGAGSRVVLDHGFPALLGDAAATVVTFGAFPTYWAGSLDVTVICRVKAAAAAQTAGVVAARENDHSLGWQLLFSNFGPSEDGYNFAVFATSTKFVEAQDGFGSAAQNGKDVVVAGVWDHAAKTASIYTRQPGEPCARFRNSNTNTNSSNVSTEPWDVRSTNPVLTHKLNNVAAWFAGAVAWVAVFDRVLSAGEIRQWSRDEDWYWAEDDEPPAFVTGVAYRSTVGVGTPFAPGGPALYSTELDALAYIGGDIVVDPTGDAAVTYRSGVAVRTKYVGDIPTLVFYKNVVAVAEAYSAVTPVFYSTTVRVADAVRRLVDGRLDLLGTTRYRR